jgi:hypothetical protein
MVPHPIGVGGVGGVGGGITGAATVTFMAGKATLAIVAVAVPLLENEWVTTRPDAV